MKSYFNYYIVLLKKILGGAITKINRKVIIIKETLSNIQ